MRQALSDSGRGVDLAWVHDADDALAPSTADMRTALKDTAYIAAVSRVFAAVDEHPPGSSSQGRHCHSGRK